MSICCLKLERLAILPFSSCSFLIKVLHVFVWSSMAWEKKERERRKGGKETGFYWGHRRAAEEMQAPSAIFRKNYRVFIWNLMATELKWGSGGLTYWQLIEEAFACVQKAGSLTWGFMKRTQLGTVQCQRGPLHEEKIYQFY